MEFPGVCFTPDRNFSSWLSASRYLHIRPHHPGGRSNKGPSDRPFSGLRHCVSIWLELNKQQKSLTISDTLDSQTLLFLSLLSLSSSGLPGGLRATDICPRPCPRIVWSFSSFMGSPNCSSECELLNFFSSSLFSTTLVRLPLTSPWSWAQRPRCRCCSCSMCTVRFLGV